MTDQSSAATAACSERAGGKAVRAHLALATGGASATPASGFDPLRELVREARLLLGMDVVFLSRHDGGQDHLEAVDIMSPAAELAADHASLLSSYGSGIAHGRLPPVIADAAEDAACRALAATAELGIRTHLGIPVRLPDGTVCGALGAYSLHPRGTDARDLSILDVVARGIGLEIAQAAIEDGRHAAVNARLDDLLAGGGPRVVYQPVVAVTSGDVLSVEALSRFPGGLERGPGEWFADARRVGRQHALEMAALKHAGDGLWQLPPQTSLNVNVSLSVVLSDDFRAWLSDLPMDRIILEITEHEVMQDDDYEILADLLVLWRRDGLRLAVDDFGAGYASMRHTLLLQPDMLKLDISLVRDIDTDRAKRALCTALVSFARAIDACVVVEGVETAAELLAARHLGVDCAQGYYLARPAELGALSLGPAAYRGVVLPDVTPPVAPHVLFMIRELVEAGMSMTTVAARLNHVGETTRAGRRWSAGSVKAALRGTAADGAPDSGPAVDRRRPVISTHGSARPRLVSAPPGRCPVCRAEELHVVHHHIGSERLTLRVCASCQPAHPLLPALHVLTEELFRE